MILSRNIGLFVGLVLLTSAFAAAPAFAYLESGRKDLDLGLGLLGPYARTGSCLVESGEDGLNLEQNSIGGEAQNVIAEVSFISDSTKLSEKLNVTGSANFKGGFGFGKVEVDAKGEFARSKKESRNSMYLFVRTYIQNGSIVRVNQPEIKADILKEKLTYDQFRTRCGDRFVDGAILGGEFIGVIEFKVENEEAREALKGSLSAAVSTVTTKTKVKLAAETENSLERAGVSINYWYYRAAGQDHTTGKGATPGNSKKLQPLRLMSGPVSANPFDGKAASLDTAGALGAKYNPTNPVESFYEMMQRMIEAAESLPATVQSVENAVPIAFMISDYFSGVKNFSYALEPTPLSGQYNSSVTGLDSLLSALLQVENRLSDVENVIEDRSNYVLNADEMASVESIRDSLAEEVDNLKDKVQQCVLTYQSCDVPKPYRSETLRVRLARIQLPSSAASRAIRFIESIVGNKTYTLNANQVNQTFGHDSYITFQFVRNRGKRPYLKEEDALLGGERTTTADRYYFLENQKSGFGRENYVSYMRDEEQPTLIHNAKGAITSAIYYFGYWNSSMGIMRLTVFVESDGKYTMNLDRSMRYNYKSGTVLTPTWQSLGRLYLIPTAR